MTLVVVALLVLVGVRAWLLASGAHRRMARAWTHVLDAVLLIVMIVTLKALFGAAEGAGSWAAVWQAQRWPMIGVCAAIAVNLLVWMRSRHWSRDS